MLMVTKMTKTLGHFTAVFVETKPGILSITLVAVMKLDILGQFPAMFVETEPGKSKHSPFLNLLTDSVSQPNQTLASFNTLV